MKQKVTFEVVFRQDVSASPITVCKSSYTALLLGGKPSGLLSEGLEQRLHLRDHKVSLDMTGHILISSSNDMQPQNCGWIEQQTIKIWTWILASAHVDYHPAIWKWKNNEKDICISVIESVA